MLTAVMRLLDASTSTGITLQSATVCKPTLHWNSTFYVY